MYTFQECSWKFYNFCLFKVSRLGTLRSKGFETIPFSLHFTPILFLRIRIKWLVREQYFKDRFLMPFSNKCFLPTFQTPQEQRQCQFKAGSPLYKNTPSKSVIENLIGFIWRAWFCFSRLQTCWLNLLTKCKREINECNNGWKDYITTEINRFANLS